MSIRLGFKVCAALVFSALSFCVLSDSAQAVVIFSQDFSTGIGARESLTGDFHVASGQLTTSYGYANDDFALYKIKLSEAKLVDGQLSFDLNYNTESCCDYLRVSVNGKQLVSFYGIGHTSPTLFLGSITGPTTIGFEFSSDGSITGLGVQLDNISVSNSISSGVPEPSTWAMMLIGFAGLAYAVGRKETSGTTASLAA